MQMITDIQIDLYGEEQYYLASAKQGDKATRFLRVQLMNNGNEFQIPEDVTLIANIQKPDGKFCYNECERENNRVMVQLTNQALAAAGTAHCDIEMRTKSGELILSSASFTIEIEKSMRDEDAILSCNEMTALDKKVQEYIDLMMAARKQVLDTEEAVKIAENARAQAEDDRKREEESRGQAENERIKEEGIRKKAEADRVAAENERLQQMKQMQTATTQATNAAQTATTAAGRAEEMCRTEEELNNVLTTQQELYRRIVEAKGEFERLLEEWNRASAGYDRILPTYQFNGNTGDVTYIHLFTISPTGAYATGQYLFQIAGREDGVATVCVNVSSGADFYLNHSITFYGANEGGRVRGYEYRDTSAGKTTIEIYMIVGSWNDVKFYPRTYNDRGFHIEWDLRQVGQFPTDATREVVPSYLDWYGNADSATKATFIKDEANGQNISISYGADGLDNPAWIAAWDGYKLKSVNKEKLKVNYANSAGNSDTVDGYHAYQLQNCANNGNPEATYTRSRYNSTGRFVMEACNASGVKVCGIDVENADMVDGKHAKELQDYNNLENRPTFNLSGTTLYINF